VEWPKRLVNAYNALSCNLYDRGKKCTWFQSNDLFCTCIHELAQRSLCHGWRELSTKPGSQAGGGGVKSFWAFEMPILINRRDAVTLLKILSPIYWNASVLRIVMAFLFMVLRKTMIMSEEWGCEVVCGATFGEERVNNSVYLLSRILVAFSNG